MKRAVASGALWTASAAAAVGLGFLAVSLVDTDTSPVTRPIAATESVAAAPSASSSSGSGSDDVAAPTPTSRPSASGEYASVGGTVFASCDGGLLQVGTAPADGWWVDDQDQHGEVQFESPTREVEVHVACGDGVPAFRDEGVRAGGNEPEDAGSSSSPASPSPGVDDSTGRGGDGGGRGRGGDDSGPDD